MKNGIWYYLKSGFKLSLILLLSQLILLIPNYLMQNKLLNSLMSLTAPETIDVNSILMYFVLMIILGLVGLVLNGYLVYKYEKWIFK